jgi:RHS repeat-associated protein
MFDSSTGLYWYHARWYDPHTGRFISQDPSGFRAGDFDLYRYVGNDPTNLTDPRGLSADASEAAGLAAEQAAQAASMAEEEAAGLAANAAEEILIAANGEVEKKNLIETEEGKRFPPDSTGPKREQGEVKVGFPGGLRIRAEFEEAAEKRIREDIKALIEIQQKLGADQYKYSRERAERARRIEAKKAELAEIQERKLKQRQKDFDHINEILKERGLVDREEQEAEWERLLTEEMERRNVS